MKHPKWQISDKIYHKFRIHTTGIGCDKKRDVDFSCRLLAVNARYDMTLGPNMFSELNFFMFLQLYYRVKWRGVLTMYDPQERY